MDILLLHNLPDRLLGPVVRPLTGAFTIRGHQVHVRTPADVTATLLDGTPRLLTSTGQPLPADAALTRVFTYRGQERVCELLAATGIPTVNDPAVAMHAGDKHRNSIALAAAGLAVPDQVLVLPDHVDPDVLIELLGLPMIVKPVRGMQGTDVTLLRTVDDVAQLTLARGDGLPLLAQRYIPEAADGDVRVVVIDGEPVAAMRRHADVANGEHRTNLHQGGTAVAHPIDDVEADVAVRAAAACGLTIAGVDLILTGGGPVVLEVNPNPGLQIQQVVYVDVVGAIARAVLARAEQATSNTLAD